MDDLSSPKGWGGGERLAENVRRELVGVRNVARGEKTWSPRGIGILEGEGRFVPDGDRSGAVWGCTGLKPGQIEKEIG